MRMALATENVNEKWKINFLSRSKGEPGLARADQFPFNPILISLASGVEN